MLISGFLGWNFKIQKIDYVKYVIRNLKIEYIEKNSDFKFRLEFIIIFYILIQVQKWILHHMMISDCETEEPKLAM